MNRFLKGQTREIIWAEKCNWCDSYLNDQRHFMRTRQKHKRIPFFQSMDSMTAINKSPRGSQPSKIWQTSSDCQIFPAFIFLFIVSRNHFRDLAPWSPMSSHPTPPSARILPPLLKSTDPISLLHPVGKLWLESATAVHSKYVIMQPN